jgi:hypothetical protein
MLERTSYTALCVSSSYHFKENNRENERKCYFSCEINKKTIILQLVASRKRGQNKDNRYTHY